METFLGELCRPAGVYLTLSIAIIIYTFLYLLVKKVVKTTEIIFNEMITLFFVIVWTYILNFLCNRTYITLVWGLVIINFLMSFFAVLAIISNPTTYQFRTWKQIVDPSNQAVAAAQPPQS